MHIHPTPSKSLWFLLVTLLLSACEKEIDIDYHSTAPLYVVEASVSDEGMTARISQTNDMDDNTTTSNISQATVTISGSDGSSTDLQYTKNGYYTSDAVGIPGVTYRIDIRLDGHHFSSTSTMQKMPQMNRFRIIRKKIMTEKILMAELLIQDIPNEENWYFMHLYRNKLAYRWAVTHDDMNPNKELQQLFSIDREGSTDDDMLREGDRLHLEIRTIDQRAYDYLYSMQLMENSGTNPIPNFTGGCLGYFSAYSQVSFDCVYHADEVEDAE